jgi:ABC-type lipoprotein release transport system permease subunit
MLLNNITFRLAWRNLWRQPRRTWLTLGAMVFANTILVCMISLQFGMYGLMIDNTLSMLTGHLQVLAPGYKDDGKIRQSIDDAAALASGLRDDLILSKSNDVEENGPDGEDESVKIAVRGKAFALASSEERSFGILVMGVQPEYEPQVSSIPGLIQRGRYLSGPNAQEVVIGSVLARNLQVDLNDEITLIGSGRDGSFAAAVIRVVGIIQSGMTDLDRSIAQMPLTVFQDTFTMDEGAHEIVIRAPDLARVAETGIRVQKLLDEDSGLAVYDWDDLEPGLKQSIQADLFSAWFMYGVLITLVAFSVLNTVLMSVLERTREFGIVMSLGLTPGRLGRLVILETAIMGALGLASGVLIGAALVGWAGIYGISFPGMEEMGKQFNIPSKIYPDLTVFQLALGPAIVFAATLLASLWPALRLYWLEPVQAMRAA